MSYRYEPNQETKKTEIVIDGFENGIAPSPHEGIGNIQGGNISTIDKEVMVTYNRTQQAQTAGVTGTLTVTGANTLSFNTSGGSLLPGTWIHITADSGTGLSGDYYVLSSTQISSTYNGSAVSSLGSTTVFLTSGTTWSVPSTWSNTGNTVDCIGGGGGYGNISGGGGGGGAWSRKTNISLTPSGSVTYAIGTGGGSGQPGGDTYFNGASLGASTVGAKGGSAGADNGGAGGTGGQASGGVGDTKFSGGNGAAGVLGGGGDGGGGGGGAAGSHGAGGNGSSHTGGTGDNGSGGAGGTAGNPGAIGQEYDSTHGSGGGGGGGTAGSAGNGGLYGGGGGGGKNGGSGSDGAQGLIYINYVAVGSTATFTVYSMGEPYQSATEKYTDTSGNTQYRYYILDKTALIWVHDTAVTSPAWFLPDISTINLNYSGLHVLNGWLGVCVGEHGPGTNTSLIYKSTSILGSSFSGIPFLGTPSNHFAIVGHQGRAYITDGNFIASYFPDTSLVTGAANIQSYCSYTAATTTGTISALIGGSYPSLSTNPVSGTRIPVFFFTGGTLPSAISANTIYYIKWLASGTTFEAYAAASGGSALNLQTGAVGTQYFNTFYPIGSGGQTTSTFTPQRLNLPFFEQAQSLVEIGNSVLIGCKSNTIYSWNQVSALPQDFIVLPENNVVNMVTVNNMAYVFAGQKGNIYITNGSTASFVIKVPDYTAGIAGTPASYIEPYFSWGGAMYMRGRVWFSILDQTSSKTGNCGGIWSFDPLSPDETLGLRLENQSSYGTYNGTSPVLLQSQIQTAIGPQYWSAWYSSITSPTYGIDFSDTIPTMPAVIETDIVPTGTVLTQKTFEQIEYKLSNPLAVGETVSISYRQNITDSYTSLGSAIMESTTSLSGYFPAIFQKGQWLQLKITLTPLASSSSSFVRLREIRVR